MSFYNASPRRVALLVFVLTLVQFAWLLWYGGGYFELVKAGAISVLYALFAFLGCILLYIASTCFAFSRGRGNRLFLASGILLVLSLSGWPLQYHFSHPFFLATTLSIVGWWCSRKVDGDSA